MKLPPIHPGEILNEEFLLPLGIISHQLAEAVGVDTRSIKSIVQGEASITAETALLLSRYFGTSAELWTGIQIQYDLEVAEDLIESKLKSVKPHPTNGFTSDIELPKPAECQCGCGGEPKSGADFLQGHDQRALHRVVKSEYGSVIEFLRHHGYSVDDKIAN